MDGDFIGNTPATLKLSPGKHVIRVALTGYKDWSREITTLAGSEVHLTANLANWNDLLQVIAKGLDTTMDKLLRGSKKAKAIHSPKHMIVPLKPGSARCFCGLMTYE